MTTREKPSLASDGAMPAASPAAAPVTSARRFTETPLALFADETPREVERSARRCGAHHANAMGSGAQTPRKIGGKGGAVLTQVARHAPSVDGNAKIGEPHAPVELK